MVINDGVYDIDSTVKSYFEGLKGFKSLSKEEEHALLRDYRYNNNLEARNKLIQANLKFACSIASSYRGRGVSFSELISEANDGLMESIEKFDLSRDIKLYSYSVWWIKQRVQAAVDKLRKMPKSELPNEQDNDTQLEKDDDNNNTYIDRTVKTEPQFIEEEDRREEMLAKKKFLAEIFKILNAREKDMVYMYYGIYGKSYKLDDIGKKYNLSKERVRQIIEHAFKKVRCRAMAVENKYL